ncbi:hypothetical protein SEVIR_9G142700v4 [Setaria viridis]|uniref:RING-type domain-containing protein n=1 Tax=Setaria viridis TaxID=4556 RepID=A0A4U6STY9_SETVI|nr:probable BOI-related E3 ubiquitin-protein ligase 3 [Setaria viridis]TKV92120.1 hypothetical protein SEVIR_9G142700v2 [Setaria viridis]
MAVDAHHLLHTGGGAGGQRQLLAHAGWAWAGDAACYEAPASAARQQGQRSPCYGGKEVVAAGRPTATTGQQVFQQSCVANPAPAAGQYAAGPRMCAADASESGVTFGGGGAQQEVMMAPRKRKRPDQIQTPVLGLGAADVAAHFQQQLADVDRLVLQHTTKMWVEMGEQRCRHARQVVAAVEAAAAKRLRAKDEEIQRIGRLNWALEERVRSLCVEAQVWRDLAQSNEAMVNALRGELQQAHDAQQARRGVGTDDAESCCCGENGVAGGIGADDNEEEEAGTSSASHKRMCTMCGKGAAEVLLLPCRHLCACAPCAAAAVACPACGCAKNGSVCVNFS